MADALDNELHKDFVIEAGELLQRLGAQLVGLESAPRDQALLDAVFRVFHSVKGGAGFLALPPMVLVCHHAEELLKGVRNQTVDLAPAELDALLEAVDVLTAMLAELADGVPMAAAPPTLLQRLLPGGAQRAAKLSAVAASAAAAPGPMDDDEFEALLDSLHGNRVPGGSGIARPSTAADRRENATPGRQVGAALTKPADWDVSRPASVPHAVRGAAGPTFVPTTPRRADDRTTVYVESARLDGLALCVDALMVVRKRVADAALHEDRLGPLATELDRVADELKVSVSELRMQPVGRLFQRFPRVVRDLAHELGKEAELVLEGGDTDIDRSLTEALADALVHLLRNAIDHGIGMPDERLRAGKPLRGHITLAASQRDGCLVITVRDDGRGMDAEVLRRHALEKGLLDVATANRLSASESFDLIFRPGFSTAAVASEISGRGFGMDVVKTRLLELGGTVELRSAPGQGTEVALRIPFARSTLPVLVVTAATCPFALPVANVEEVCELPISQKQAAAAPRSLRHRGRSLPLVHLSGWPFAGKASGRWLVVLRHGVQQTGCVVDAVSQCEDVICRPLGTSFIGLPGIAGSVVLADGRLALLVDAADLVEREGAPAPCLQMKA